MLLPADIPILTRSMAQWHFLMSGASDDMPLSPEFLLQLDASVPPDHPSAPVQSYLLQWWTTLDPESDVLSDMSIQEALEYHEAQSDAIIPERSIPGTPTPALLHRTRNKAQGYSTFYESTMYLTARRAAGFLMLSEAAARKKDDADIPLYDTMQRKSPEDVRKEAVKALISLTDVPLAKRDLGVRLTALEAVDVFSPDRGTRDQDQTDELTNGDIDSSGFSAGHSKDDANSSETFSTISDDPPGPPDLGPADYPVHFEKSPLRTVGSDAPVHSVDTSRGQEKAVTRIHALQSQQDSNWNGNRIPTGVPVLLGPISQPPLESTSAEEASSVEQCKHIQA